jgi:hypothetical protein
MSISTGPLATPPPKKRGLGCLGCGCVVLALLAVLFFVMMGSLFYMAHKSIDDFTSTTPPTIPSFDGGDDLYAKARQKLADFDHDVTNHQAATIRLSADELNTLIARNPDVVRNHIHAYVSMTDNEGRLQASFPTGPISHGWVAGRYASFDVSFEVHFDPSAKSVAVTPHTIAVGDKTLVGANSENDQSAQTLMHSFVPNFNLQLNAGIRKNADGAALLDQAKSIEIQGSQLVIETQ